MVEYEPADLTVTVEAGIRLSELQGLLGQSGQWLPLDPPCAPEATIGGILATNASGPARIAYGTARDLVIGMTVATAEGSLVTSGGRVVKNVAGYDMAKLHIGALGSLGVIVQVSFKVAPLPKTTRTMQIDSPSVQALAAIALRVRDAALPATGVALVRLVGAAANRLLLRFAGSPAAVDRACAEATAFASSQNLNAEQAPDSAWAQVGALRSLESGVVIRLSHTPSSSIDAIGQASALGADVLSYPTAGITYARLLALSPEQHHGLGALRASLEGAGGALVIESAPASAKAAVDVWGTPGGDFALMRRLKDEMDPNRVLNPGRFLGGL